MTPRIFYLDDKDCSMEVRVFLSDCFVCIHPDVAEGVSVTEYGFSGRDGVIANHLIKLEDGDGWKELT